MSNAQIQMVTITTAVPARTAQCKRCGALGDLTPHFEPDPYNWHYTLRWPHAPEGWGEMLGYPACAHCSRAFEEFVAGAKRSHERRAKS